MKKDREVYVEYTKILSNGRYDPKAVAQRVRYIRITDAQRVVKTLTTRCAKQQ